MAISAPGDRKREQKRGEAVPGERGEAARLVTVEQSTGS